MLYTEIVDNYTLNKKLMHFVARTCVDTSSAASSDVFAVLYLVRHAQNEPTTEPVGAPVGCRK